jgi:proteasome lid subunit RPN8/RPN11
LAALAAAYDRAWPLEAIGFLLGSRRGAAVIASEVLPLQGACGHGQFEVADYELRRVGAWCDGRGVDIVALFHSHPGGSLQLSAADRAALRRSEWPWLIVARGRRDEVVRLAAYRAGDGRRMTPRDFRLEGVGRPRRAPAPIVD